MAIQRWRGPVVLRVKSAIFAAVGVAVAVVFFPLWFAIAAAVLLAAWGLGLTVLGASVAIDTDAGVLALRMGLIARRIRLASVTAVLVDEAKVSIARADGGEVSLYTWRKSALDGWLGVPAIAGDIGHAIAGAVAVAKDAVAQDAVARDAVAKDAVARDDAAASAAEPQPRTGTSARTRSALATALLAGTGVLALVSAFLVKLHWHNPVMTTLAVILALALGVSGLFYVLFTLWLALTGQQKRSPGKAEALTR